MPIDKGNPRDLLTALGIIGATTLLYSLLFAAPAHAQCVCVFDAPVERSLNIAGGAGRYLSQITYLNSLMQILTIGVSDAGSFAALFPGWKDPGPNAATAAAKITATTLKSYEGAINVALSQAHISLPRKPNLPSSKPVTPRPA
jgi:hypothetical protein